MLYHSIVTALIKLICQWVEWMVETENQEDAAWHLMARMLDIMLPPEGAASPNSALPLTLTHDILGTYGLF